MPDVPPLLRGFAKSPERIILEGVQRILETDPLLVATSTVVRMLHGDPDEQPCPDDDWVADGQANSSFPQVRATLDGTIGSRSSEVDQRLEASIALELFTWGVNPADQFDFIAAVRQALMPSDPERLDDVWAMYQGRTDAEDTSDPGIVVMGRLWRSGARITMKGGGRPYCQSSVAILVVPFQITAP